MTESSANPKDQTVPRTPQVWAALAAFAVAAAGLFNPTAVLVSRWLHDDSFYYLKIAANLAAGLGPTFDGLHFTNGFHPLFALLLVPVFWLTSDPETALYLVRGLESLLLAITSLMFFRLIYRLTRGSLAAAWLSVAFLVVPAPDKMLPLCRGLLSMMESGLNALFILLFLLLFFRVLEDDGRLGSRFYLGYGVVAGLLFLVRLDNGFLILAAAGAHLVQLRSDGPGGRSRLRGLLAAGLIAGVLAGGYLASNWVGFGHPIPISGRVKSFRSALVTAGLLADGIGAWVANTIWFAKRWPTGIIALGGLGIPLLAVGAKLGFQILPNGSVGRPAQRLLIAVAAASFSKVSYYAVFQQYSAGAKIWYYVPEFLIVAGVVAVVGARVLHLVVPRRAASAAALIVLVSALVGAGSVLSAKPRFEWEGSTYEALPELEARLGADAVIGSLDAGQLGYFLPNIVVNLDGLVNDERFLEHLTSGRIGEYVVSEGIDFVVNRLHPGPDDKLVRAIGAERLELFHEFERVDTNGLVLKIYRVKSTEPR